MATLRPRSPVSTLSTHVLDAVSGTPAAGVPVTLEFRAPGEGPAWTEVATATTDDHGRSRDFPRLRPGVHRLVFDTAAWFAARHGTEATDPVSVADGIAR